MYNIRSINFLTIKKKTRLNYFIFKTKFIINYCNDPFSKFEKFKLSCIILKKEII